MRRLVERTEESRTIHASDKGDKGFAGDDEEHAALASKRGTPLAGRTLPHEITATMGETKMSALRLTMLALCTTMLGTIIYTCVTVGSPFDSKYLVDWMPATLIDFYVNVFVLLCWIWYKEDSWVSTLFWTAMLVCLGSFGTTLYVFVQLSTLPRPRTVQNLLLKRSHAEQIDYEHEFY